MASVTLACHGGSLSVLSKAKACCAFPCNLLQYIRLERWNFRLLGWSSGVLSFSQWRTRRTRCGIVLREKLRCFSLPLFLTSRGSRSDAEFEVLWESEDRSWVRYNEISHLRALADYFETIGIDSISQLTDPDVGQPSDDEGSDLAVGQIIICTCQARASCPTHPLVAIDDHRERRHYGVFSQRPPRPSSTNESPAKSSPRRRPPRSDPYPPSVASILDGLFDRVRGLPAPERVARHLVRAMPTVVCITAVNFLSETQYVARQTHRCATRTPPMPE